MEDIIKTILDVVRVQHSATEGTDEKPFDMDDIVDMAMGVMGRPEDSAEIKSMTDSIQNMVESLAPDLFPPRTLEQMDDAQRAASVANMLENRLLNGFTPRAKAPEPQPAPPVSGSDSQSPSGQSVFRHTAPGASSGMEQQSASAASQADIESALTASEPGNYDIPEEQFQSIMNELKEEGLTDGIDPRQTAELNNMIYKNLMEVMGARPPRVEYPFDRSQIRYGQEKTFTEQLAEEEAAQAEAAAASPVYGSQSRVTSPAHGSQSGAASSAYGSQSQTASPVYGSQSDMASASSYAGPAGTGSGGGTAQTAKPRLSAADLAQSLIDQEDSTQLSAWDLAQNAVNKEEEKNKKEPYRPKPVEEPKTKSASQLAAEAIARAQEEDKMKLEIEKQAEALMAEAAKRGQDPMKFALHQQEILRYMEKNSDELVSFEDYEDLSPEEKLEIERQLYIEKQIAEGVDPDKVDTEVPEEYIPAGLNKPGDSADAGENGSGQEGPRPVMSEEMLRMLSQEVVRENTAMILAENADEDIASLEEKIFQNLKNMMGSSGEPIPPEDVGDLIEQAIVANRESQIGGGAAPSTSQAATQAAEEVKAAAADKSGASLADSVPAHGADTSAAGSQGMDTETRGMSAVELARAAQKANKVEPKPERKTLSAADIAREAQEKALRAKLNPQAAGETPAAEPSAAVSSATGISAAGSSASGASASGASSTGSSAAGASAAESSATQTSAAQSSSVDSSADRLSATAGPLPEMPEKTGESDAVEDLFADIVADIDLTMSSEESPDTISDSSADAGFNSVSVNRSDFPDRKSEEITEGSVTEARSADALFESEDDAISASEDEAISESEEDEYEYIDPDELVLGEHTQAEVDEALDNLSTLGLEGEVYERAKRMLLLELAGSEAELDAWLREQDKRKTKSQTSSELQDDSIDDLSDLDEDELERELELAMDEDFLEEDFLEEEESEGSEEKSRADGTEPGDTETESWKADKDTVDLAEDSGEIEEESDGLTDDSNQPADESGEPEEDTEETAGDSEETAGDFGKTAEDYDATEEESDATEEEYGDTADHYDRTALESEETAENSDATAENSESIAESSENRPEDSDESAGDFGKTAEDYDETEEESGDTADTEEDIDEDGYDEDSDQEDHPDADADIGVDAVRVEDGVIEVEAKEKGSHKKKIYRKREKSSSRERTNRFAGGAGDRKAEEKSYQVSTRMPFMLKNSASFMDKFEEYIADTQENRRLSTGFKKLDAMLRYGLHKGTYFIDAQPQYLKNGFMQQIADRAAESGIDVLYISTELSRYDLMLETISRLSYEIHQGDPASAVSAMAIMTGEDGADLASLKDELNWYRGRISEHLFILDQEAVSEYTDASDAESAGDVLIELISSIVREGAHKPVVLIDNIENILSTEDSDDMKPLMDGMKKLAKELGIPILMSYGYTQAESEEELYPEEKEYHESLGNMCDVYIELVYAEMIDEDMIPLTQEDIQDMVKEGDMLLINILLHKNRRPMKATLQIQGAPKYNYFEE